MCGDMEKDLAQYLDDPVIWKGLLEAANQRDSLSPNLGEGLLQGFESLMGLGKGGVATGGDYTDCVKSLMQMVGIPGDAADRAIEISKEQALLKNAKDYVISFAESYGFTNIYALSDAAGNKEDFKYLAQLFQIWEESRQEIVGIKIDRSEVACLKTWPGGFSRNDTKLAQMILERLIEELIRQKVRLT